MTLIKDLIEIDDHVDAGDFVLSLTEGVNAAERTVSEYVPTPQLVTCFDSSLKLIRDALDSVQTIDGTVTSSSKAAYLHGSFGSGKSHFMAILDLLLANDPHARGIPELGGIVQAHDGWLKNRKFLLVPYHLIGADDLESAIFGGYTRFMAREHPDILPPPLYRADLVLDNADELRSTLGDEAFFAQLNGGQEEGGGKWGKLAGGWDAGRYDAAMAAQGDDTDRLNLVSAVVGTLLTGFKDLHAGFVDLDTGLSRMSVHAKSLGYDAVVLFLDELILWLAGRIKADLEWAREEGSKLAKLVESGDANRPAPIVSFIARQRDLRELVGGATGSEQMDFFDALQWWEGRFTTITLEDKNLPVVANRRLLRPKDAAAKASLDAAFDQAFTTYSAAADLLLGADTDRQEQAKLVYPFSPTLVTTLVDVSSVLQRNRTALKVMKALLVEQRETLEVGELIPVGELYDVIAQEDQPFSESMQAQFDHARNLYRTRIRPQLMSFHGIDGDEQLAGLPHDHAFHGQDRLVKTVILAALVPATPALQDLTAAKLEQLNAGSIESFIPGNEVAEVVDLFRQLISSGIGDLEMQGDPTNPRISLRLHGVDVESIVSSAKIEDTPAARRRKARDLVAGAVEEADLFSAHRHKLNWRGSAREVEMVFGNIRDRTDLPDDRFVASDKPKVVIDFPFDPDDLPPSDDLARVENLIADNDDTMTMCWLPSHLNASTRDRLGRLVVMDHLMTGDNFTRYASHLPQDDRATAERQIQSQANTLRAELEDAFEEAYGIRPTGGSTRFIDEPLAPADQFKSLHHGLAPAIPAAATLKEALDHLSGQLLATQFPDHPAFSRSVRPADVEKVWQVVQQAMQQPQGRLEFVAGQRPQRDLMLGIATPLGLGETGENHFQLGDDWKNRFFAAIAAAEADDPGFVPSVAWARRQLDKPSPRGLSAEVANLVIMTVALQTDHTFVRSGSPFIPEVKTLGDDLVLVRQALPDQARWEAAVENAQFIFGWDGGSFLSADNVAKLAASCRSKASAWSGGAGLLLESLEASVGSLDSAGEVNRTRSANAAASLVGAIQHAENDAVIRALADLEPPTSAAAIGKSLSSAESVAKATREANWSLLEIAFNKPNGDALRSSLRKAFEADELVLDFGQALRDAERSATGLMKADVTDETSVPGDPKTEPERAVVAAGEKTVDAAGLSSLIETISKSVAPGQQVTLRWEITEQ